MSWWRKLLKGSDTDSRQAEAVQAGGHGTIELREGTADFEWFIAQAELESRRNLSHGAEHLAKLLSFDPGNPEWIGLLERYITAGPPDAERLIAPDQKGFYAAEALRAFLWQRQGRLADACQLLAQITRAKEDARYLEAWVLGWLEPAGAVERLPEVVAQLLFSLALVRFPEAYLSPARRLREIRRWAALSARYARTRTGDGTATMVRVGLYRKSGMFEEAEAILRPALQQRPDWHLATAMGLLLRQKGALDQAERAFELALQLDPTDMSARMEAGDTFFEREQWQRALGWYESALDVAPRHEWAYPSALYCRAMASGDVEPLRAISKLADEGNQRAAQLYNRHYFPALPEPQDAIANLLRQFRETLVGAEPTDEESTLAVRISGLDAPSNGLAFRLEMDALHQNVRLEQEVEAIAQPDPRVPITEVRFPLWSYKGTAAFPALPPPGEDVVRSLDRLARPTYDENASWAAASFAAEELGPARAGEILAGMLYPPPVPQGTTALAWIPRVQHIAMQVVAHLDEGWDGSVRREALLSALLGPQDWTTVAAIRALARLGRENGVFAPKIGDAFQLLSSYRPEKGYCCWEQPLYEEWVTLPHLFPNERQDLQAKLCAISANSKS